MMIYDSIVLELDMRQKESEFQILESMLEDYEKQYMMQNVYQEGIGDERKEYRKSGESLIVSIFKFIGRLINNIIYRIRRLFGYKGKSSMDASTTVSQPTTTQQTEHKTEEIENKMKENPSVIDQYLEKHKENDFKEDGFDISIMRDQKYIEVGQELKVGKGTIVTTIGVREKGSNNNRLVWTDNFDQERYEKIFLRACLSMINKFKELKTFEKMLSGNLKDTDRLMIKLDTSINQWKNKTESLLDDLKQYSICISDKMKKSSDMTHFDDYDKLIKDTLNVIENLEAFHKDYEQTIQLVKKQGDYEYNRNDKLQTVYQLYKKGANEILRTINQYLAFFEKRSAPLDYLLKVIGQNGVDKSKRFQYTQSDMSKNIQNMPDHKKSENPKQDVVEQKPKPSFDYGKPPAGMEILHQSDDEIFVKKASSIIWQMHNKKNGQMKVSLYLLGREDYSGQDKQMMEKMRKDGSNTDLSNFVLEHLSYQQMVNMINGNFDDLMNIPDKRKEIIMKHKNEVEQILDYLTHGNAPAPVASKNHKNRTKEKYTSAEIKIEPKNPKQDVQQPKGSMIDNPEYKTGPVPKGNFKDEDLNKRRTTEELQNGAKKNPKQDVNSPIDRSQAFKYKEEPPKGMEILHQDLNDIFVRKGQTIIYQMHTPLKVTKTGKDQIRLSVYIMGREGNSDKSVIEHIKKEGGETSTPIDFILEHVPDYQTLSDITAGNFDQNKLGLIPEGRQKIITKHADEIKDILDFLTNGKTPLPKKSSKQDVTEKQTDLVRDEKSITQTRKEAVDRPRGASDTKEPKKTVIRDQVISQNGVKARVLYASDKPHYSCSVMINNTILIGYLSPDMDKRRYSIYIADGPNDTVIKKIIKDGDNYDEPTPAGKYILQSGSLVDIKDLFDEESKHIKYMREIYKKALNANKSDIIKLCKFVGIDIDVNTQTSPSTKLKDTKHEPKQIEDTKTSNPNQDVKEETKTEMENKPYKPKRRGKKIDNQYVEYCKKEIQKISDIISPTAIDKFNKICDNFDEDDIEDFVENLRGFVEKYLQGSFTKTTDDKWEKIKDVMRDIGFEECLLIEPGVDIRSSIPLYDDKKLFTLFDHPIEVKVNDPDLNFKIKNVQLKPWFFDFTDDGESKQVFVAGSCSYYKYDG